MASGDCREDNSSGSSNLMNFPPSKKQRVIEETLVDRISELPDPLIVQILSFLPTKDAFSTPILSKRWLSLCTFVDSFNFSPSDFRKTENGSSIVEYVLAHSVSPKIKKLELEFDDCSELDDDGSIKKLELDDDSIEKLELDLSRTSYLQSLMDFAVERNVENVVICFGFGDSSPLPQSFYTCSSLITLVFSCVFFKFDGVIEWKSLKSLKLEHSGLSDDNIVNLLAGCPALETIELSRTWGFHRLEINSSNLKRLNLTGYSMSSSAESFEILAPYIQHLEISGNLKCRLVDVSSVVNAMLTFKVNCIKDISVEEGEDFDDEEDSCHDYHHQALAVLVRGNLEKLSTATKLVIGTWFTDALCMLQLLEGVSIQELKCKYVTLELHIQKFNLYGAASLLRALPHMETLSIDMETRRSYEFDSRCRFGLRYLAKGDDIDLQSWIYSFVFPKLKKVQIVISCVDWDMDHFKLGLDKLSKLCEFLLKTAPVLEEFVIISNKKGWSCRMNCVHMFLYKLAENLISSQRCSAKAMIY